MAEGRIIEWWIGRLATVDLSCRHRRRKDGAGWPWPIAAADERDGVGGLLPPLHAQPLVRTFLHFLLFYKRPYPDSIIPMGLRVERQTDSNFWAWTGLYWSRGVSTACPCFESKNYAPFEFECEYFRAMSLSSDSVKKFFEPSKLAVETWGHLGSC